MVVHLDADYTQTIIGRSARDYAWIMARTPTLPAAEYDALVQRLRDLGYSLEHLRVVPQQWPEPAGARVD
ncbi:outer membrane lipoprotein Blc [compost metagenome]